VKARSPYGRNYHTLTDRFPESRFAKTYFSILTETGTEAKTTAQTSIGGQAKDSRQRGREQCAGQ